MYHPSCRHLEALFVAGLLTALVLVWPVEGQLVRRPMERFTVQDGLSNNTIYNVTQDQAGFLWIIPSEGINRYNGYSFKHFWHSSSDSTSVSSSLMVRAFRSMRGGVWITGRSGVNYFDPYSNTFKRYMHDPEDPASPSVELYLEALETDNGLLWMGRRNGVDRLDPQTGKVVHFEHDPDNPSTLPSAVMGDILMDESGILWVGSGYPSRRAGEEGALNRLDPQTGQVLRYYPHSTLDPSSEFQIVSALAQDSEGVIWVGTYGGFLFRFDKETGQFSPVTFSVVEHPPGRRLAASPGRPVDRYQEWVSALYFDTSGILWIGAFDDGLFQCDVESGLCLQYNHRPDDPSSLSVDRINDIFEDDYGHLWVGTQHGLNKIYLYRGAFQHVFSGEESSLTDGRVNDLQVDIEGNVWVGTTTNLFYYNRVLGIAEVIQLDDANHPNERLNAVSATMLDEQGYLWIGTVAGLIKLDTGTGERVYFEHKEDDLNTISGNFIQKIVEDDDRHVWVTSFTALDRINKETNQVTRYPWEARKEIHTAFTQATTSRLDDERIWITTSHGLSLLNRQTGVYRHVSTDIGMEGRGKGVWDVAETGSGDLWISTPRGLFFYEVDKDIFQHYERARGLPSVLTNMIFLDQAENVWFSTSLGLSRLDPDREKVLNFDARNGMLLERLNPSSRDMSEETGEVFIGGDNGFASFFPTDFSYNEISPRIAISIRTLDAATGEVDETLLKAEASVEKRYANNNLDLQITALHFGSPTQNEIEYQLEGEDDGWRRDNPNQSVQYTNLAPGRYTLRTRASNGEGFWSNEVRIPITIMPPWWQTVWAWVMWVLLGSLLFYVAGRIQRTHVLVKEREKAVLQEMSYKAEAAEERAKILEETDLVKSRFFANISHEFRTPLTLILGPVSDALSGLHGKLGEVLKEHLKMMLRNGRRLEQLIDQLLDLSRLEAGRLSLTVRDRDLNALVRGVVVAFYSVASRRSISISLDVPETPFIVFLDADKIEKVLTNLLSNAFKFTRDKGSISISVSQIDNQARLRVCDDGYGIAPQDLPHIFDRFYQADSSSTRSQEGTGIGLAFSKEIVELHRGSIEVESRREKGTCFTVWLQLGHRHFSPEDFAAKDSTAEVVQDEIELTETELENGSTHAESPLILIVEDNEDVLNYLADHLSRQYRLARARNGEEGLERIRFLKPDLIISDVMMPVMDGFEMCRRLKADNSISHIPILLLTALATEEDKIGGLTLGADDYLSKPFSSHELLVRAENLIVIRRRLRTKFSSTVIVEPAHVEVDSAEEAFLKKVAAVVEDNFSNTSFTVDALADEVGISPRQLRRRLRENTGLSAGGYIRSMRLQRAAQLLEQRWGTVSQIAYAVGFKSAKHFSTLFKSIYGVSPSEYPPDAGNQG